MPSIKKEQYGGYVWKTIITKSGAGFINSKKLLKKGWVLDFVGWDGRSILVFKKKL